MTIDKLTTEQVSGTCLSPSHGGVRDKINEIIDAVNGYTLTDFDIYVDNSVGSDENGTGSRVKPYQTFDKAYEIIESSIIVHTIRICLVKTGRKYVNTHVWNPKIRQNGSLTIIGIGASDVYSAGPFTLTGSATVGTNAGIKLSDTGASWAVDDLYGKFIRMKDGTRQNYVYPVFKNDADDVWSVYYTDRPSIADTFDGVTPGVTIESNQFVIDLGDCEEYWSGSWQNARFALCNLNLDLSGSTVQGGNLNIKGFGAMWADYVRVVLPTGVLEPVMLEGPEINYYLPLDASLKTMSESSVVQIGSLENAGLIFERTGGPVDTLTEVAFYSCASRIHGFVSRDTCVAYESAGPRMIRCAFGRFMPYASNNILSKVLLNGKVGSVGASFHMGCSGILNNVHVLTGTSALRIGLSMVSMSECTCESSLAGYGLEAGPSAQIAASDDCSGLVGTTGQIQWTAPEPNTTASWPASNGGSVNDGQGAYVNFKS